MTLRTAVAVKGGPKAFSIFACNRTGYRIYLHEDLQSVGEEILFIGAQAGIGAAGTGDTSSRTRIVLCPSNCNEADQANTQSCNKSFSIHFTPQGGR